MLKGEANERVRETFQIFHALEKSALIQVFHAGRLLGYKEATEDFRGIKTSNE